MMHTPIGMHWRIPQQLQSVVLDYARVVNGAGSCKGNAQRLALKYMHVYGVWSPLTIRQCLHIHFAIEYLRLAVVEVEVVVLIGAESADQQHRVDYGALLALRFVLAQRQLDV